MLVINTKTMTFLGRNCTKKQFSTKAVAMFSVNKDVLSRFAAEKLIFLKEAAYYLN